MDRQPDTTNKSPLSIRRVGSQVESTTRCLIECDKGQAQVGRGRGECKASWRCGKCGEIFYENCDNILAGFSLVCGLNKCISQKGSVPCLCACACVWLQLAALAAALVRVNEHNCSTITKATKGTCLLEGRGRREGLLIRFPQKQRPNCKQLVC